jgi:hypothetical protein
VIVDEHDAVPNENLIVYSHTFANERMTLNFAQPADPHILLYLHEGTDASAITYDATVKVSKSIDDHVLTYYYIVSDAYRFVWHGEFRKC